MMCAIMWVYLIIICILSKSIMLLSKVLQIIYDDFGMLKTVLTILIGKLWNTCNFQLRRYGKESIIMLYME